MTKPRFGLTVMVMPHQILAATIADLILDRQMAADTKKEKDANSISAVARRLGIHQATMNAMLAGKPVINVNRLYRVGRALDYEDNDLTGLADQQLLVHRNIILRKLRAQFQDVEMWDEDDYFPRRITWGPDKILLRAWDIRYFLQKGHWEFMEEEIVHPDDHWRARQEMGLSCDEVGQRIGTLRDPKDRRKKRRAISGAAVRLHEQTRATKERQDDYRMVFGEMLLGNSWSGYENGLTVLQGGK
jgi:hypothetical protein